MRVSENWFKASDGKSIFYNQFLPDDDSYIRFVVQIIHGMAEHSQRYYEFAKYLVSKGGAVYISDLRGHGQTCIAEQTYGVWKSKNPWNLAIEDLKNLNDISEKNHPDVPNFLIGHSMGSFMARAFISNFSYGLKGVILTGSGENSLFLLWIAYIIASIQCLFLGKEAPSKLLDKLSFSKFNKRYSTPYQWLTRDEKIVNKYIADPFCGGVFSTSFYRGFTKGLIDLKKAEKSRKISRQFPILLLSGSEDPVGDYSKGVIKLAAKYRHQGFDQVQYRLYKGGRHEILNELNKKEVYKDIYNWINKNC